MTTIAIEGNFIVTDSKIVGNFVRQQGEQKIFVRKEYIISISGRIDIINYALKPVYSLKHMLEKLQKIDEEEAFGILVYYIKSKKFQIYNHLGLSFYDIKPPYATGSGADFAMGAMLFGASATQAVMVASKLDIYTDSRLQIYDIEKNILHLPENI